MVMVMKVVKVGRRIVERVGGLVVIVVVLLAGMGGTTLLVLRVAVRSVLMMVSVSVCRAEVVASVGTIVFVGIGLDGMQDIELSIGMGKLQDMLDFLEKN